MREIARGAPREKGRMEDERDYKRGRRGVVVSRGDGMDG